MRTIEPLKLNYKSSFILTGVIILLILLVFTLSAKAYSPKQAVPATWFITGTSGVALLTREVTRDFKFLANEFRHEPGIAFDVSIARTLGSHWEPTFRMAVNTLMGENPLPDFSATGYQSELPVNLTQEPVEYITQSNSAALIFKYFLRESASRSSKGAYFHPFLEGGIGINNFTSELRYKYLPPGEEPQLIFREQNGEYSIGVAQLIAGLGIRIGAYGNWNAVVTYNAEWINYASLDAVHNYSHGERIHAKALVSRITAGVCIPVRRNEKKGGYLPFRW